MDSFFSLDNLKKKILPFLYTEAIIAVIAYLYTDSFLHIPVTSVMVIVMFAMFDFMHSHKKLGILIYMAFAFGVLIVIRMILFSADNPLGIAEWFLTGGLSGEDPAFLWTVLIGFTFFIASVAYYFTHVIYRIFILTLICLIPMAIYVKAVQSVPFVGIVIIAALNMFIYIYMNRLGMTRGSKIEGKKAAVAAYVDFAVAAVLLALIIPKPEETPFYEKFEEFSTRFSIGGQSTEYVGRFHTSSGNADEMLQSESRLLYIVSTENVQYLKTQTFDEYDPNIRVWVCREDLDYNGYKQWENMFGSLSYTNLLEIYKTADSSILQKAEEGYAPDYEDRSFFTRVRAQAFPAAYIITPQRTASVTLLDDMKLEVYRSYSGETFTNANLLNIDTGYDIYSYDQRYVINSGWINSGLCDMTYDEYKNILSAASNVIDNDDEIYPAVKYFLKECDEAGKLAAENYSYYNTTIDNLAAEITSGLTYDYEKAEAIAAYFHNNGFVYDLAYRAPEESDTPEFFLTESKRGTCSDFATAFCLLARAEGLIVRYSEGFVPMVTENTGIYYVTTENAHAYPEVYIPGAGWVIYEPTVGGANTAAEDREDEDTGTDYVSVLVVCVAVFIGIVTIILIVLSMPLIEECTFAVYIRFKNPDKAMLLLYARYVKKLGRIFDDKFVNMTAEQVAEFTEQRTGLSLYKLIEPFKKVCYGGISADRTEVKEAYALIKMQIKLLKKYKKQK